LTVDNNQNDDTVIKKERFSFIMEEVESESVTTKQSAQEEAEKYVQ
jgi:hypothetical protein